MTVKPTYEYYKTVTSSQSVTTAFDDYIVDASAGNLTLTLPSASGTGLSGKIFKFRRIDTSTNVVAVSAAGSDLIEGVANIDLNYSDVVEIIRYDSTHWRMISESRKRVQTAALASSQAIPLSADLILLDTATAAVAAQLPSAASVPLGTRYIFSTTSATNAGTVIPAGTDTINGGTSAVTVALNVGKTFASISSSAWVQY